MKNFNLILINILALTVLLLSIQNFALRSALHQNNTISVGAPENNDLLQELTTK
jgi:hypothetical protein